MRVAAVDIGTNSVLLLVAEQRGSELVPLIERAAVTRLGQGVDASHTLAPEAAQRTLERLKRYADEIRGAGAVRVAAVGTSALRDAAGVDAFLERAGEILGVTPRVVSGEEEARLTFAGALSGLLLPEGPVLVADVGGGSTEIIAGDTGPQDSERAPQAAPTPSVRWASSLDIGSVRLTERHIKSDPIRMPELAAVRDEARRALARLPAHELERRPLSAMPVSSDSSLSALEGACVVGVAGTVTTLAVLACGLTSLTAPEGPVSSTKPRTHGTRLMRGEVGALIERLARLPLRERKALPGLDEARADIIVAGAIIVEEVLAWAGADVLITSDRGVRWGLAQALCSASSSAQNPA